MKKINIAEILKDCPKGMELYSPLCGKCVFDRLNMGTIICKKQNTQEITFTSEGYYMLPVFDDCECMIFPSKNQRDWSKFQRPFKDGDIVFYNDTISIFKEWEDETLFKAYVCTYLYMDVLDISIPLLGKSIRKEIRFATEEEKQKLFDAIKANSYKWNAETKTLEKLIEPKFKVGDRVKQMSAHTVGRVVKVDDKGYYIDYPKVEGVCFISFMLEKDYELLPNKFDITTLKPFDKILTRDGDKMCWYANIYSHYLGKDKLYQFRCMGTITKQCIPYKGNEHLLGTTNDCDEYYKTW